MRYQREKSNHRYKIECIADALFRALPPKARGYDLLEMGAGTGIHAEHLLVRHGEKIRRFTLCDLSKPMLDQAKTRLQDLGNHKFVISAAETFRSSEKFDAVYMSGAMHHFSDPLKAIRNLKRCLKRGGVLVICEPNVWNPLNCARAVSTGMDWGQFFVTHTRMRRELAKAGFRIATDRALHWRGDSDFARVVWPHARLERYPVLSKLSVMFLIAGIKT